MITKPLIPFLGLIAASLVQGQTPMKSDYSRSTTQRWLSKPVLASKLVDSCESLSTWTAAIEDQGIPKLSITHERAKDGKGSLRLRSRTTGATPIPHGRYYGTSSAVRVVAGEDWTRWNRLSFWVYPDLPGFRNISLISIFHNGGKEKLPEPYGKMGKNYLLLKNHQWNHVVWEIGNLPRDRVTGVEFAYRVQGNEPGAADTVQYDIDRIELQKVNADKFEGWAVAPGRISFSHAGYSTGSPKSAIASDLTAKRFQLIDTKTGKVVLNKTVAEVEKPTGHFQLLDFTEVTKPGSYVLKAGRRQTQPFLIGEDVWESSLSKAINFFYAERCGYAIPGVHDVCHADWVMKHDGKSIVVNGGWHDAGDLSQNLSNTAEADYAMFTLAERLQSRSERPELLKQLLGEASWGLQFVLKTSFHDGYRTGFNTMDRWTDGIAGTPDDMLADSRKDPIADLTCASDEAIASRVLSKTDPILAAHSLQMAREDWKFGTEEIDHPSRSRTERESPMSAVFGTSQCEMAANAALASLELWKSTHDLRYADKAVQYGATVLACQEISILPGLDYPLTGFFYRDRSKKTILRYVHLSREQLPTVALVKLCESLPNHKDWMKWYSAVTLYSKYYQQEMAKFTQPYGMLANSLFKDDEYLGVPEGMTSMPRNSFRDQVTNGVKVGDHYYVRRFPVWFEFRGNHGTSLAQATGLSEAAHLRGDYGLASLLQGELEWVIGRNPFVESTMWGEGYDYAPQYTAMSGDLVGSLPVGIETRRDGDAPYWPTENCHNWKEVWVNPTGRWIWLMKNLSGPALVTGFANGSVSFKNLSVGSSYRLIADRRSHKFIGSVPEGVYEVTSGKEKRSVTLLPGGTYSVDLRAGQGVDLRVASRTSTAGDVTIQAWVTGKGIHNFQVRGENLRLSSPSRSIRFNGASRLVEWRGQVVQASSPWVALVVPDGKKDTGKELTGYTWRKGDSNNSKILF